MFSLRPLVLISTLLLAVSASCAYAKPGGAAGPSDGMAGSHMGKQGLANTNGPNATDRDKGLGRAADKRNEEAADHSNAGHPKKHTKADYHKRVTKSEGHTRTK